MPEGARGFGLSSLLCRKGKFVKVEAKDGTLFVQGVRGSKEDGYEARCSCGFRTSGWDLKKHAEERIDQHREEHATGTPAQELIEFEADRGLADLPYEITEDDLWEEEGE